jgi:hypothetical protein
VLFSPTVESKTVVAAPLMLAAVTPTTFLGRPPHKTRYYNNE